MFTSRFVACWFVLSVLIGGRALLAQPPETEEGPLPEIPETQVIGRPDPFPASPLGEGTLVTPSRTETLASQSGGSVTVITQEQIAATQETHVADVLRQVVGVDVAQSGGPGRLTSVFVRGANSQHTKVLIDGIPVNDPISASRAFDFGALTVDNIERIEVARGPLSLEYGSDAIGGVINIVTKRGEGPLDLRVSGMGGSYQTHQETVSASGGTDKFYYSFGGSYHQSDGLSTLSARLGGLEDDLYRNATLSGRFGWTPSPAFNVDYVFRYTDADVAIDGFGPPPLFARVDDLIRQNRNNSFFNRVQIQSVLLDGLIEQKVGFSLTDYNRRDTNPGFFDAEFLGQSRLVDWQANLQILENNVLTVGVDYLQEEGSTTSITPRSQNLSGIYIQDRFSIRDWSFTTIGVRWDDHSTAGAAETYRFTQLFRICQTGTDIHGSIGRGFRAPAIVERFLPFFGNRDLRPEFSKGWDVGVEQVIIPCKLTVDVTYFRNDFRDLIVGSPPTFQLRNIGLARASGVEVVGRWNLHPCTTLTGTYTYTDAVDLSAFPQSPTRRLPRRPKNKATFSISHRFLDDCASANLYFLYVGNRDDFGVPLADYIRVDVSGKYRISYNWEAFARIQNLTDSEYEEVTGFSTADISAYGGLSYIY